MIKFLTTSAVASELEAILINAKRKVTLVSPYLKFSDTFIQRLQDATRKGVHLYIVYREDDLQAATRDVFHSLDNLHLYNCSNLHAKCYFNEDRMVITSMNFYEFSEKNNREMGVLVSSDESLYQAAVNEADSIMAASDVVKTHLHRPKASKRSARDDRGQTKPPSTSRKKQRQQGHCIQCGSPIKYNPEAPFCRECYAVWAKWGNADHAEKHCHTCGTETETSMAKPQCYTCYRSEAA